MEKTPEIEQYISEQARRAALIGVEVRRKSGKMVEQNTRASRIRWDKVRKEKEATIAEE